MSTPHLWFSCPLHPCPSHTYLHQLLHCYPHTLILIPTVCISLCGYHVPSSRCVHPYDIPRSRRGHASVQRCPPRTTTRSTPPSMVGLVGAVPPTHRVGQSPWTTTGTPRREGCLHSTGMVRGKFEKNKSINYFSSREGRKGEGGGFTRNNIHYICSSIYFRPLHS